MVQFLVLMIFLLQTNAITIEAHTPISPKTTTMKVRPSIRIDRIAIEHSQDHQMGIILGLWNMKFSGLSTDDINYVL